MAATGAAGAAPQLAARSVPRDACRGTGSRVGAMAVHFMMLVSRQGKIRLMKFYNGLRPKEQNRQARQLTSKMLSRSSKMSNFIDYEGYQVVYKRYASLFFVVGIDLSDNELLALELIHLYVEVLDRYFGNVCELDIIFQFHKAYFILDELLIGGRIVETGRREILRRCAQMDILMDEEEQQEEGDFGSFKLPG